MRRCPWRPGRSAYGCRRRRPALEAYPPADHDASLQAKAGAGAKQLAVSFDGKARAAAGAVRQPINSADPLRGQLADCDNGKTRVPHGRGPARTGRRQLHMNPQTELSTPGNTAHACWCGNGELVAFSPDYARCGRCETLISLKLFEDRPEDTDPESGLYGREYWFSHQENDLGLPDLRRRSRSDLPERCIYWLRRLVQRRLPPGRVLEIGCAHGGFLHFLSLAGFQVLGLELSPWVANFANVTFGVPVDVGRVEEQSYPLGSFDLIVLMDVVEHLPDPLGTLAHCFTLLRQDGLVAIQTPNYPAGQSLDALRERNDPFLKMLLPEEHLNLFSRPALESLFRKLGAVELRFEKAIFQAHDMFVFASREPLQGYSMQQIAETLCSSPRGRIVQALFDKQEELDRCDRSLLDIQGALEQQLASAAQAESTRQVFQEAAEQRLKYLMELTAAFEKQNGLLAELQQAATVRLVALQDLTRLIQERDARIVELEQAANERLAGLHQLTATIEAKDALIARLESALQCPRAPRLGPEPKKQESP